MFKDRMERRETGETYRGGREQEEMSVEKMVEDISDSF